MNDNAAFERIMAQLGVRPLKDNGPVEKVPFDLERDQEIQEQQLEAVSTENDEALFLQALESIPVNASAKDQPDPPAQQRFRKLKKGKGGGEMVLDLHGLKLEEAMTELTRFVGRAYAHKRKSVMVITGKGLHSKGGRSVLKPHVERWILQQGRHYLRAYSEAPRAYGGRGAFILYLHSPV